MIRKESHNKNGRSEIPRSAKQVELVKRAVSRSPEVLSPMTSKESRLTRVVNKPSNINTLTIVPTKTQFSTQVNSPRTIISEKELSSLKPLESKAETTKHKHTSSNASFKASFT